jgi:hypothetical protein
MVVDDVILAAQHRNTAFHFFLKYNLKHSYHCFIKYFFNKQKLKVLQDSLQ